MIAAGVSKEPAISVVFTFQHDTDQKLIQVLGGLSEIATKGNKKSVLLLGRYRYLKPNNLPALKQKFPNLEINFINPANSGIYGELEFDEIAVKALRQDLESSGQHKFETKVIIRDEAAQIIAKAQGIYVVRNFLGAV